MDQQFSHQPMDNKKIFFVEYSFYGEFNNAPKKEYLTNAYSRTHAEKLTKNLEYPARIVINKVRNISFPDSHEEGIYNEV